MTAPAPLLAGYVRAKRAVPVFVDQPVETGTRRFRGKLLGAMYARGTVHHYRVEHGDGTLFLVPPGWLVGTPPLVLPEGGPVRSAAALEVVL